MDQSRRRVESAIATMSNESITVRGLDLAGDMIGQFDIGQLFYFLVTKKKPDEKQSVLINAMLVSVAEHGMMPSVIAARLTLLGAPESFQGAVASGLLGLGDVFVGPSSKVARILQVEMAELTGDDDERARQLVENYFAQGKRIPGLGHPHHRIDPRTEKLFALQRELDASTRYTDMMLAIHREACRRKGGHLTLNVVAAIGAVASDIGIDWRAVRGIGLVARTVGLVGHLLEELEQPAANAIWDAVHAQTDYTGPIAAGADDEPASS